MRTLVFLFALALSLALATPALSQQSAGFNLKEHTFNQGGRPAAGVVASSAGFTLSLDAIGGSTAGIRLSGAGYSLEGGFVGGLRPASEVLGLSFSTRDMLVWDIAASAQEYRLYRDNLAALAGLGYGDCLDTAAQPGYLDLELPAPEAGFFYLVTAANRLDQEGPKGTDSAGAPRPNDSPCP